MSLLDDLARRGPVANPFSPAPPRSSPPPRDDPEESFTRMESALDTELEVQEVESAILPCESPWLDLSVTDPEGNPAKGMPYTLTAPGLGTLTGTLDDQGRAHFENRELGAGPWNVETEVHYDDEGAPTRYDLTLVRAPSEQAPASSPPPGDQAPLSLTRFEFSPPNLDERDRGQ
ncbi:hypothetical protein [Corallococcus macrosporus]|uniref:Uncharacterized protein n=1 Tax=Myxococcus fulvus (strain ATCC BAA-855 / HW-1) TaxID=483219 RepID=F8CNU3_MYXFH|nr:hypothetical protein [Corallococcus macrosporus]AEI64110.1 hypothetical protein LILAB_10995 [Corallococcus macrosporus]